MTFFVERSADGICWTCLFASEHYIDPHSFSGPQNSFPAAETPDTKNAFAGRPGWLARVRFNDDVMALYVWDKVPENPADPDSFWKWGWRLQERFPVNIPAEMLPHAELSVM